MASGVIAKVAAVLLGRIIALRLHVLPLKRASVIKQWKEKM